MFSDRSKRAEGLEGPIRDLIGPNRLASGVPQFYYAVANHHAQLDTCNVDEFLQPSIFPL